MEANANSQEPPLLPQGWLQYFLFTKIKALIVGFTRGSVGSYSLPKLLRLSRVHIFSEETGRNTASKKGEKAQEKENGRKLKRSA